MKAIILCSGEGQRLRPLTYELAKPMLGVQGKPVLEHIVELLKEYGVHEIFISVYHLKNQIKNYFRNGEKFGVSISYIDEDSLSGTAGPIKKISSELSETFLVLNGDELKDIDLHEMYKFHKENKAKGTIALIEVEDPSSYGVAKLEGNKIIEFIEKPKKEEAPSNFINSGLYIFEPEILQHIPEGFSMLEKDIFPKIANNNQLYGYKFKGQWFDTGTLERYENAIKNWKGVTSRKK